jgi:hypothetical protein
MGNSSKEDTASIASVNNEFFYKHFIEEWLGPDSGDVPKEEKYNRFAKEQEACRKDVERVFGVLQSCWAIVRHPHRQWCVQQIWDVMTACVIIEEHDDNVYDQGVRFL